MRKKSLFPSNSPFEEANLFSNKAAVVLHWLLTKGIAQEKLSIRQISRESGVSLGLVQKVIRTLVHTGFVLEAGVHTSKTFRMVKAAELLSLWANNYSIVRKCKAWTYETGFASESKMLDALRTKKLGKSVVMALHSAAEYHGFKNSNLSTLELYVIDNKEREIIESVLKLSPKERGYDVLLIRPYYTSLLSKEIDDQIGASSPLLTYLDLVHYPLRGTEQADYLLERHAELRHITSRA